MKDIIHIGYPKTGTTWFQDHFFVQVKNRKLIPRNKINTILTEKNAFLFNVNNVKKELDRFRPYIISHEGLCGNMHNFGLNGFMTIEYARRLREIADDPIIVLFIRNQFDIILSSYLQYIKNGGTYGIKEYVYHKSFNNNSKNAYLFSFDFFKYDRIIGLYKNMFGEKNIKVYLYEDFLSESRYFLKSFVSDLNLKINLDDIDYRRTNISYKKNSYLLGRSFNRFSKEGMIFKHYFFNIPGFYRRSKNFLFWFNKHFGGKNISIGSFFNEKERACLRQYFADSNNTLIRKHKIHGLKKYQYPL